MGILDRLDRWLGGESHDDPERLVAVASIAPYRAPAFQQVLEVAGLHPRQTERFDAVTGLANTVLLVPRRSVAEAERVLRDFNRPG